MSLADKLQEDMKQALRARDQLRLSTIRMLRSSVSYARIDKGDELTDDEVTQVLAREAKRRLEAADAAEEGGRVDVSQRERAELEIIKQYLPEQLDGAQIEAIARETIADVAAVDIKDRGKVMGTLMQRIRGKADGKLASSVVEKILRG